MKYLGIDFGSKRVGLAITDDNGVLAFPYKIIKNNNELLDSIHNICGEEEIGTIIIGESLDLSGLPNKIMKEINEFKLKLKKEIKLPVYSEKEFMTTVEARGRGGKEMNNSKKIKKEKNIAADASAAALILQRYIDRKNKK